MKQKSSQKKKIVMWLGSQLLHCLLPFYLKNPGVIRYLKERQLHAGLHKSRNVTHTLLLIFCKASDISSPMK